MRLAISPLMVLLVLALPAPQPFPQHPAPQRFVVDHDSVFLGQVLGRQRWPEPGLFCPGILLLDQLQHASSQFLGLTSIGTLAGMSVLEPLPTFFPIPSPQPFRLPIAQL